MQDLVRPKHTIGNILAPSYARSVKAGSTWKMTPGSNANVETDRDPGSTVTGTNNTGTKVLYSCSETSDRQTVDDSEIAQYGGDEEKARLALTKTAAVNVATKSELKVKNAYFALDAMTNESSVLETINAAIDALKLFHGEIILAGSSQVLRNLRSDSDIQDAMKRSGIVPAGVDPRFIANEALAASLNINEVVEGRGDVWSATGLVLEVKPDIAFEPKQAVQAARTMAYIAGADANGNDQFLQCYTGYDDSIKSKYVDVETFIDVEILNESLIKVIDLTDLLDAGGTSS